VCDGIGRVQRPAIHPKRRIHRGLFSSIIQPPSDTVQESQRSFRQAHHGRQAVVVLGRLEVARAVVVGRQVRIAQPAGR
jgi:hypothetical protein